MEIKRSVELRHGTTQGTARVRAMNEPVEDVLANYFAANNVKIAAENSAIVEFFRGKNVFITGATGFLGKLLIEKLLRACGGVDKIYILVRPKRGVDSSVRVEEIFNDMVRKTDKIVGKFAFLLLLLKQHLGYKFFHTLVQLFNN